MINTGITLVDVRAEAMEAIKLLKSKQIDVKTAQEIKNLCNTVIDVAKVQVAYIQAIPQPIKDKMTLKQVQAIAGTLIDRDADLDISLDEISENQKKPYELNK